MSGVVQLRTVDRLGNGDLQAFTDLFGTHRERLWRILHFRLDRRVLGRVDVDDVVQEVFLEASQRIAHYRQGDFPTFFLWLRLVALQTLGKVHRRHLETRMRS